MRRYETICIIDPDLSKDERVPIYERLNDLVPQQGGFIVTQDEWGNRKLAYEIKKKTRAYYVRLDYCGTGAVVNEMERFFRIDDRILKYMTIQIEEDADVEGIKADMAAAAEAKVQEEQAAEQAKAAAAAQAVAEAPAAPEEPVAPITTTANEEEK